MNKKEMAAKLAEACGLSQAKASDAITALFDTRDGRGIIATALADGDKVALPGFGTFVRKHREARVGTNPSTKAKIDIAAKDYPHFRAGKSLKDRVG